jgi:hypothetical protein
VKNKIPWTANKRIVCKDGFTMSVQARATSYCRPRVDNAERYFAVEVGYPNMLEPLLMEWAEDEDEPTNTVYGYVPSERVSLICVKHGGIVSGELPVGVAYIGAKQ